MVKVLSIVTVLLWMCFFSSKHVVRAQLSSPPPPSPPSPPPSPPPPPPPPPIPSEECLNQCLGGLYTCWRICGVTFSCNNCEAFYRTCLANCPSRTYWPFPPPPPPPSPPSPPPPPPSSCSVIRCILACVSRSCDCRDGCRPSDTACINLCSTSYSSCVLSCARA